MKSKLEAIATHLMMDISELKDYRYHFGRTSQPVFAIGDSYYCITKLTQKPAKHRDGMIWNWFETKDEYLNTYGYHVWESKI
jgi:hypothetical protein